ncbi:MAG: translocation/assembly module TamB domain-containing protein [Sandaracinaceae bacterium]
MTRARIWQSWRRWMLVLGFFALGIPVSSALLVRSGTSRERLHGLATGAIREELGLIATIGSVQLRLVPFSLVARDISLDDPIYGHFADAEELAIRPSFRTLIRGGLDIDAITIRQADLRLVIRNGQIRNLPRFEGGGASGPPTLPFDELHVLDSTLTVDAQPHAQGQIRHVDLHVRGTFDGIGIEAHSTDGWARHRGGREEIVNLRGEVEVTENDLRVPSLELETPDLSVRAEDFIAPLTFGEYGYTGTIDLTYDLEHTARLPLPEGTQLPHFDGRVTVHATLESEERDQSAHGTVDFANVHVQEFGIGSYGHLEVAADRESVRVLEGSVVHNVHEGGTVDVTGSIGLDPERGFPTTAHAHVDDFSFVRLMSALDVTQNGIVEWIFDGDLDLAGTLDPPSLEGPIALDTRDFRVTHEPYHAARQRRVIAVSRGRFTGSWSIRDDAIRFENLVGELPRSRIRGDVLLGFHNELRVNATGDIELADVGQLDQFAIAGSGAARCEIDGTFQDPNVRGHVRMNEFVFDDFRLGDVESDWNLDPDGLGVHFPMVSATKLESRYRVSELYLDFHRDRFELTGGLHLDRLLLADFYHVFGFEEDERFAPWQGEANGQASLHYTNGFPSDSASGTLDVGMDLAFERADLDGFAFDEGRLLGHWRWLDWSRGARGAELDIEHLALRKGEGTITLDGRMALGGQLRMTAVADRIALSQLEGIGDRFVGLDGVGTAIGQIGGTFDVMRADFDVGVTNVTYEGRPMGDGRFHVRMTDPTDPYIAAAQDWDPARLPAEPCAAARSGLAHADWAPDPPLHTVNGPEQRLLRPMAYVICGTGLDQHLRVDAAIGRTQALPIRGRIYFDQLDLAPFLPQPGEVESFEGGVSGVLSFASGAIRRPETLRGQVLLRDAHLGLGEDLRFTNQRDVDLRFADGTLVVRKARFTGPDSRLRVRGQASIERGLALSVDGDVDLEVLSRLSHSIEEADGRLRAHFNVSGELADPELFGDATIEHGSLQLTAFEPRIEHIGGTIRFSQRSVLFEDLSADVAGGHLDGSGTAQLREQSVERYDFALNARGIEYQFAEGIDSRFGARTRLTWAAGDRLPRLSGEVRVHQFTYTRPIELRSLGDVAATFVRGAFRSERTEVRRYDPDQDSVELDLTVVQRNSLRIDNNLINAQVNLQSGDTPFRIVGTDQRFGVQGAMQIANGQIFFQNNTFDIRRGTISFDDTTRIDPRLDIEATTEIRRSSDQRDISWRVFLTLTGSAENLHLTTRSEPDLAQPDILMLLAFRMTRSELQQLQQGGDLASAAALEAISSVTGVSREVQRALPIVDDIHVTTGYNTFTQRSEPQLSVGNRIAERVRLSATTSLGESRQFRGALDWQLDENQHVGVSYDNYNITGTNSFGNLGVDWGYRLEFE